MKVWFLSIFTVLILIFGCAQQAPPQLPSGSTPGPDTGNGVPQLGGPKVSNNTTAVSPPTGDQTTCSLTLTPSVIAAGGSTDIGFAVFADDDTQFTYNCGDEILGIATGGLTSGSRLCQFNSVGEQTVWIKADGVICAQKTLTVQPSSLAPKNCYIDQSTIEKDFETNYYKFTVRFDGFASDDELVWVCDSTTSRKKLGGDEGGVGVPLRETVSCDYTGTPRKDFIEVSVGGISCGQVSTR